MLNPFAAVVIFSCSLWSRGGALGHFHYNLVYPVIPFTLQHQIPFPNTMTDFS